MGIDIFGIDRRAEQIEKAAKATAKYNAAGRIYKLMSAQEFEPPRLKALADALMREADELRGEGN